MEAMLNEKNTRNSATYERVLDVLEPHTFTHVVDAWRRNPDVSKITWSDLPAFKTGEALGYGSIEACQRAGDAMSSQLKLLQVGDQTCVVKNEVISMLRKIIDEQH